MFKKPNPNRYFPPWSFCNSILRASLQKGSPKTTLLHLKTLLSRSPFAPDHRTFHLLLRAFRLLSDPKPSSSAHSLILKSGFLSHDLIQSSLFELYLYFRSLPDAHRVLDSMPQTTSDPFYSNLFIHACFEGGEFERAKLVFGTMPVRDLVSWNSILGACAKGARFDEAFGVFRWMVRSGVRPDGFTFSTMLSVCARVGAGGEGEHVHELMVEGRIKMNYVLNAALIDMYAKCGDVTKSSDIFEGAKKDHVSVWNTMISGLAMHGLGLEALEVFTRMEEEHVVPDNLTFVGLLTACSHCGMVREGRDLFDLMRQKYSISPSVEHYGAMVDLLARAGQVLEAYDTIKMMPMEPDIVIWRTLLSACRNYQQTELGEIAMEHISGRQSGDYVLLCNMYSLSQRWGCAQNLWKVMKENRIRKKRGLSWLEVDGKVHRFKAGDRFHPEYKIYQALYGLTTHEAG